LKVVIIAQGPAALSALEAIAAHRGAFRGEDHLNIGRGNCTLSPHVPEGLSDQEGGDFLHLLLVRLLGEGVVEVDNAKGGVPLEGGRKSGHDRLLGACGVTPIIPP